jgi:hypothetical protein
MILREYQESISTDAAKMLEWVKICYLAMEVRTGKTLAALAAADKYGAKVVLFVTKLKAISSIQGDYDKLNPSFTIDIINFEQLGNVVRKDYDLVIVDEAHSIGAFPTPSERAKRLKEICAGLPIIYLSGTPTPEGWSQIYHQFYISSFSPFKEYKNFYAWAKEFVTVKKKYFYNRQINDYSCADKAKIDELTKHLFISFSQTDAGFEQLVQEEIIHVRMMPTTYALIDRLRRDHIYIGRDGQEILADTAVKLMSKFHQMYSGTVLAEDGNAIVFDNSKIGFIKQHFAGRKIAIFYKFKAEGTMILCAFGNDRLTSDPEEFNASTDKIFYCQVQSGREGVNLSSADCLIMLNIDFSALSYWQARARMQTKDRTKEAKLYWIFAENGIEDKIHKAVMDKRDYSLSYFKKDFPTTIKKQVS